MIRMLGMLLAAFLLSSQASAQTTVNIVVHNRTGTNLYQLRGSYTGASNSWGLDLIPNNIIYPETQLSVPIRLDSGVCVIYIWARYANGADHTLRIDACSTRHIDALPDQLVKVS